MPHIANITTQDGLLYKDGRLVRLPEADYLAHEHGFNDAESMVKAIEASTNGFPLKGHIPVSKNEQVSEELKDSFCAMVDAIAAMQRFLKEQKDLLENSSARSELDLDAFMGEVGKVVISHNKHLKVLATT